jgi:hypothetical protein
VKKINLLALIVLFNFSFADFLPPKEIQYMNKTYKLAFENKNNNIETYEYTTNNESINNWTSLLTIKYNKNIDITPIIHSLALKKQLDKEGIKDYSLYLKDNHSFAKIIYEPNNNYSTYESDVFKSFHLKECNGLVNFQFAKQYQAKKDLSKDEKYLELKNIVNENTIMSDYMGKNNYIPECK